MRFIFLIKKKSFQHNYFFTSLQQSSLSLAVIWGRLCCLANLLFYCCTSSPPMWSGAVDSVALSRFFGCWNVNPGGLVRTHWAVNLSVALQGVSALVRKVGKVAPDALRSSYYPTASMCVSSAGYLTRICDILIVQPARVTDRWKQWRLADVKAFSHGQIICPGAQRGTWVNFMVRLFYHLARSVSFSCGNLVPVLSGPRSQWTRRGTSQGL